MNLRPLLASVVLATCFTGCATFTPQEMSQIRQHGVSPVVVGKMEQGHVLSPRDVIELTHRGVPDNFIIRQIEDAGVDYVLTRNDIRRLEAARVSRPVMDALFDASRDFASRYSPDRFHIYAADPYYYSPYYYAPYPYYYPYGGVSLSFGGGRCWGGGRHWR